MLDTIRRRAVGFALGESGRVEQQKALPFAWTAGLIVGAAAIVSAPGVAEAVICPSEGYHSLATCTPKTCGEDTCDTECYWQCVTEHVCHCW